MQMRIKTKPPITKYPGNRWLARQVEKSGSDSTIPFIHGVVRGALANPLAVDPGTALEEVLKDADMEDFSQDEFDKLSIAFLFLWNDTARSLSSSRPFPEAVSSEIRTEDDEELFLQGAVDMAEGFKAGFSLRKPPAGIKLQQARSWLRDIASEAGWCRGQLSEIDRFRKEYPEAEDRKQAIQTAVSWIEECMGWTALYAGMDAEVNFKQLPFNQGKDIQ